MMHIRTWGGAAETNVVVRAGRRLGQLTAILGLLLGTASCSFIIDKSADQCETNDDCSKLGTGLTCSAERVCVGGHGAGQCTTNQECLSRGPNQICRKSDFTCVSLTSPECTTIIGDPARDDAFMFGSVLPTTGNDEALGKPVDLAIQLAMKRINSELSGIPVSAGVVRPFLYIGCDDKSDLENTTAINAAKHLAETVKVPAIIGEAFSGSTIAIANGVTIKNKTLLISPAATSDTLTHIPDNDLVWRTSPPDVLQSAALKRYVPEVEALVREDFKTQMMNPEQKVRIAVIHNADSYGVGLADALVAGDSMDPPLQLNGIDINDDLNELFYKRVQYDETDTEAQAKAAHDMADVGGFNPHIVLLFGFTEAIGIYTTIEQNWMGGPIKPRYVMSDAILGSDLIAAIGSNEALRKRTSGTVPGTKGQFFDDFVQVYNFQWKDDATKYTATTFGAAGGYDSVFLLAYSTATVTDGPETGPALAAGLMKLSDPAGASVVAGPKDMSKGITELSQGKTINYTGVSGPLDFDSKTGEAQSDIQIWCITTDTMGVANSGENSGRFYSATSKKLEGPVKASCNWDAVP